MVNNEEAAHVDACIKQEKYSGEKLGVLKHSGCKNRGCYCESYNLTSMVLEVFAPNFPPGINTVLKMAKGK